MLKDGETPERDISESRESIGLIQGLGDVEGSHTIENGVGPAPNSVWSGGRLKEQ